MDYSPPGSFFHGIFQARTIEWVAISSSRGSSRPRNWTCIFSLLHWQVDSLPLSHLGSPTKTKALLVIKWNKHFPVLVCLDGLPQWLSGKESTCNAGDMSSIPRSGRSLGGRNGNPLQYSCLENPMDRGAWGLQSVGLQRVRYDWMTNTFTLSLTSPGWIETGPSHPSPFCSLLFIYCYWENWSQCIWQPHDYI